MPRPGVLYDEYGSEMQDPEVYLEAEILAEAEQFGMVGFCEQEHRKCLKTYGLPDVE